MRAFLAVAAAAVAAAVAAVACGGTPAGPAHPHHVSAAGHAAASPPSPPPIPLTARQACQRLRADIARTGNDPDVTTLRRVADGATAPRLAADARTAVRDIGHTGIAPLALALLRSDCARAGVHLPARG